MAVMGMKISCPNCNANLGIPYGFTSKRAKCPRCGTAISIPEAESENDIDILLGKQTYKDEYLKDEPIKATRSVEKAAINKKCPYCAEEIHLEAKLCRYCNKSLVESSSNKSTAPVGLAMYLLHFLSSIIPVVGIVLGIIYLLRQDIESKRFGLVSLICGFLVIPTLALILLLAVGIFLTEKSPIAPFHYLLF